MCTKILFIFFLLCHYASSYDDRNLVGTPCPGANFTGVCKNSLLECDYAIQVINTDHRKAFICGFRDGDELPCCPTQNLLHTTGVFQKFFRASREGVLRTNNMTCRYEGKQPFLCCQDKPEVKDPPEHGDCPPLPKPQLGEKKHFLWNKCLSYQRYFNACVVADYDSNTYERNYSCGIPKTRPRIFGGTDALPKQFPHMALVGSHNTINMNDTDIKWYGAGSLISEKFVLTAAHVLVDSDYGKARYVLLGTLVKDVKSGIFCNVIRTISHKCHESGKKIHDIALLELHERVKFNEFVRPICLPLDGQTMQDSLVIAGWGEIDPRGTAPNSLQTGNIVENQTLCQQKFSKTFYPDTMICGGGEELVHDTCRGDSGGPLMGILKNINCTYVVQGIVSYGSQCGKGSGVYTRVTAYLDWIMENVWPTEYAQLRTQLPPKNVDNCGLKIKNKP